MFCTPKECGQGKGSMHSENAPGPAYCLPWPLVGKAGEQDPVANGRLAQDRDEGLIVKPELDQLTPVGVADPLL